MQIKAASVVRKGDWKLLVHFEEWSLDGGRAKIDENEPVELYNLNNDPGELKDLAMKNTAKRDELLDELVAWWKTIDAPVPAEPNLKKRR